MPLPPMPLPPLPSEPPALTVDTTVLPAEPPLESLPLEPAPPPSPSPTTLMPVPLPQATLAASGSGTDASTIRRKNRRSEVSFMANLSRAEQQGPRQDREVRPSELGPRGN